MKGIYRRGDRAWRLKYDIGRDARTGKRLVDTETVRGTKKDAEKRLREILGALDRDEYLKKSKVTVGQCIEEFLANAMVKAKPVTQKTYERYCQLLRIHVMPSLGIGQMGIQALKKGMVKSLYAHLSREGIVHGKPRGLSFTTLRHVHRALSMAMEYAIDSEYISKNPCHKALSRAVDISVSETKNGRRFFLQRDQLDRLLIGARENELFPLIALAAGTGARRGELLALSWQDLDFETGMLRIERSVECTNQGLALKGAKNDSSKRTIQVDPMLVRLFKTVRRNQDEEALKQGARLGDSALIFPRSGSLSSEPSDPSTVSKRFTALAKSLGFDGLTFHALRHTHASILIGQNVPITSVSKRLGHANSQITLSVYAHALKGAEDQAFAAASSITSSVLSQN